MLSLKDIRYLGKQKKARDTQGLFVAEGIKLFEEAPPALIEQVVMTRAFAEEHPDIRARIPKGAAVSDDLDEARFFGISDTKTPQGILCVLRKPEWNYSEILNHPAPLFVFTEDLQDPGNAGTILRTAEAAGANAVFFTENTVDVLSPKVVRSTMGSVFRVPHFQVKDTDAFFNELRGKGIKTYAAHLRGRANYTDVSYLGGSLFVIGNESRGITDETAALCDTLIRIPMMGRVESLNAAMAAGVLIYEAQRQRRLRTESTL